MSDSPAERLDVEAELARIGRDRADMQKVLEEARKFVAEGHKLEAERRKLDRERWWWPTPGLGAA